MKMVYGKIVYGLILVALLAPAACRTSWHHEEVTITKIRRIELPEGTVFSVGVGEGDTAVSSITVPEGHPDAGTYTTTSPHLHVPIQDAMQMLGKPGAKAWIEVDEDGEIQTVTNEMTLQ